VKAVFKFSDLKTPENATSKGPCGRFKGTAREGR
jgi:hypothetical protein